MINKSRPTGPSVRPRVALGGLGSAMTDANMRTKPDDKPAPSRAVIRKPGEGP